MANSNDRAWDFAAYQCGRCECLLPSKADVRSLPAGTSANAKVWPTVDWQVSARPTRQAAPHVFAERTDLPPAFLMGSRFRAGRVVLLFATPGLGKRRVPVPWTMIGTHP